ncbi:MAG: HAD-IA family hydrolase [Actinomycetota bacterium]|nr:HAD-IA family hydrolase [Actinomycetota bacterium]
MASNSWLLCDYGEVLCLPPHAADVAALVEVSGLSAESFDEIYWRRRLEYDRGDLTAATFWASALGGPVPSDHLAALVDVDIRGWVHPSPAALEAAERAAARGMRLALLSNAPHEVADVVDGLAWLAPFSPRLFSARLGATKPDPSIYRQALCALGAAPGDVWFVDDREANVAAASALGINAIHYRGDPAVIDAIPPPGT